MSLRLLHTADVHLDAPFRWLGSRGNEQRRQLRETFRSVVDLALERRVDAFLVAGDLFDSNSPSQDTVDLVQSQLQRLTMPVFLLPGTHDCFDNASVYRRLRLPESNVFLFQGSRTSVPLDSLGLTVHARANHTKTSSASPLSGLEANPSTRFNVALAHGSLRMPGTVEDFPLTERDVAAARMDYVALGHWHSYQTCFGGKACYSGPPELLDAGGGQGQVLLVELDGGPPKTTRCPVGKRRYEKMELRLDEVAGTGDIQTRVRVLRDPDLVLGLTLNGLRPLDLIVDAEALTTELSGAFFAVKVTDRSHPLLLSEELDGFSEDTVLGQFVRRMRARITETDDEDERRVVESALQFGVALLQGKKVLR
ncbi:MAG: DNA repair exonuclease [Chloroflexota bacterium]|nr:MAG: DNA repair exonuclease [Chloroflexota bacterium]